MPEIELPDGTIAEFPDDTPPMVMKAAIQKHLMATAVKRGIAGAEAGRVARSEAPASNTIAGMRLAAGGGTAIDPETSRPDPNVSRAQAANVAARVDEGGTRGMEAAGFLLGAEGLAASGAIPGAIGSVGRAFAGNPKTAGAVIGAVPGVLRGNVKEAAIGAAGGAGIPLGAQGVGKLVARRVAAEVSASLSARLAHTLSREAPEAVAATSKVLQFGRASSSLPGEMAATAPRMAQGGQAASRALESAGLSPELAAAEAAKMGQATGEVAGNLPGVVTPAAAAVKMPALALAEDVQQQIATLRGAGLSKPQIVATLREKFGHDVLSNKTAEKLYDLTAEVQGGRVLATEQVLPTGSKVMPPYRGGPAQPSMGPARVPRSDADLQDLLKQSLEAYQLK